MKILSKLFIIALLALCAMQSAAQNSATSEVSPSLKVWIDNLTLTADGETVAYLHISEADEIEYSGFQMVINVPKGINIHKVKVGRDTFDALPSDRFTATHTVNCNLVNDGKSIKLAVISSTGALFYPDDRDGNLIDELCAIAISADNLMINGDYEITMEDIKFMLPNSYAYIPESVDPAILTIVGGQDSSGVDDITVDRQEAVYYDLNGRRVYNPSTGLYVTEGGKVLVK